MKTITIEIMNEQVMKLFRELEVLRFIRIRNKGKKADAGKLIDYKGAMKRQPLVQVDMELKNLRDAWD